MTAFAQVTGCRKFGEATSVPREIRAVAVAAAARVVRESNQGPFRNDRHARWSYVQA
ncbi:hypothetical protein GCM10023324_05810 [Streptomyces youssoufiensis]